MEKLDTYHPYWSGKLAAEYDSRAGEIGALLVSATQALEVPYSASRFHERLLSEEYGSMSRDEFTLRITLARTANTLRKRWLGGSRYLLDSSLNSSSTLNKDWYQTLAMRELVYVHLGVSAAIHVKEDVLLDGFYIERLSPEGEADMFGMGLVFQKTATIGSERSLGDLLVRQSILSYGLLDSLEPDADVDLVVKDPAIGDAMFAVALDATDLDLPISGAGLKRRATGQSDLGFK